MDLAKTLRVLRKRNSITVSGCVIPKKTRKQQLDDYYKTSRWAELRRDTFERDNYECVMCGEPAEMAHHRRYPEVLGTETISDLTSLCKRCHFKYHFPETTVILREQLKDDMKPDGTHCPVCKQFCKEWCKSIVSTSAAELCRLVSMYKGQPIHHDDFAVVKKDRNFSQLDLWGLIVPASNQDTSKRASGMWSPTQLGVDFVLGRVTLKKYITTFNNVVVDNPPGTADVDIDIYDALQQKYDHAKLMSDNYSK